MTNLNQSNSFTQLPTIKLGLIKGRHPLPVDKYILEEEVQQYTKDELLPLVIQGLNNLEITDHASTNKQPIDLYLTGLTIVSLVTVELLTAWGYSVDVYGFNPNTKEYYKQGTFTPRV